MINNVSSILSHDGKYIGVVKKALKSEDLTYLFNNGKSRITGFFKGNDTIRTEAIRKLPPSADHPIRTVIRNALHYANGSTEAITMKSDGTLISFVYKDKNGQVIKKFTKRGDSFTAIVPERDRETREIKKFYHYSTNPKNGEEFIDKNMQKALMDEAINRVDIYT